jgi:RNA polymerase sigma-70 factor (ECF subfamily)
MTAQPLDFHSIHDAYRPRILRYLTRLAGAADAEDLTQQVLLKISQSLGQFRGDASLSTWIYRIATNAALDQLRRVREQLRQDLASGCSFHRDDQNEFACDRKP